MQYDIKVIAYFLGVEGRETGKCMAFRAPTPYGILTIQINAERSAVNLDLTGDKNSAPIFGASFNCERIRLTQSRKMKPSLEFELAGNGPEFRSFFVEGPPTFTCGFVYF